MTNFLFAGKIKNAHYPVYPSALNKNRNKRRDNESR